ncbi:MAG: hypothetical protein LT070_01915 [Solirubrobacteraceae bacterium]|nr:hypothetical protein [Solirubrobacteraceae bacterium]
MRAVREGQPIVEHPNRDKPSSKVVRVAVITLLVASAALIAVILVGGWNVRQGMTLPSIAWIAAYLVFAVYVARWNRGVLPVTAALAVIMMVFGVIAVPAWIDRDAPGFAEPALSSGLLGALTAILVAVQALLAVVAMHGFHQAWNVEVEVWPDEGPLAPPHDA